MIDYQVLCQTIADWKAGQRPSSGPHEQAASPEEFEDVGSGLILMDDESAMTHEEIEPQASGYEDEGAVTYGDDQTAPEPNEEQVEDEDAEDDLLVEEDDEEIPVE